jgi:hypothetical protein
MTKVLQFLLLLSLGAGLHAQPQANNWLLGPGWISSPVYEEKRIVLSFYDDSVSVVDLPNPEPQWNAFEAIASISDIDGKLIYYTNNYFHYNRNHELLANSEDINAPTSSGASSTYTNGVLYLPFPGDTSGRFHVMLTMQEPASSLECPKLQWSLIDGDGDGGLGMVIDSVKARNVWDHRIQEKLAVIRHANGRDWWLIARKGLEEDSVSHQVSSSSFSLALLSPEGVNSHMEQSVPVKAEGQWGELVFSRDGTKLAEACMPATTSISKRTCIALYQFDRCVGQISYSDSLSLPASSVQGFYGVAFDLHGNKLYATSTAGNRLYQLSVSDMKLDSPYQVYRVTNGNIGQLELGKDGNIYVVVKSFSLSDPLNRYLSVIRNPSAYGGACAFDTFGVALGVNMNSLGLPPQPNYALGALEGSGCDTLGSTSSAEGPAFPEPWTLYPNPASDRAWLEGLPEGSSWVLVDVLGRPLRSGFARQGRASVELDGLARGLYLVIVQPSGRAPLVRRLMVSGR